MSDDEMEALRSAVEARYGESYVEVVDWLRDQNQLDDVARRLRVGDLAGAVAGVEDAANRFAATVIDGYHDAAKATATWVDGQASASLVTYDATNPRAAQWAVENRARFVAEVTSDIRESIAQVVGRGISRGTNPIEQAREIRSAIGLTAHQEQIISNYRRALTEGDYGNALSRELRDGRSDKLLRRMQASKSQLSPDQVEGLVERYRKNWVVYRSEVIGRTESLRATHEGNEEMLEQAYDDDIIARDDVVREWHTAGDGRVRESHASMSGQTRRPGQPFVTGDGYYLRYPGDPSAPAGENLQCRCVVSTRIATDEERSVKTPKGFDDQHRKVITGLPARAAIDDEATYSVRMGDIDNKLFALPGGGNDKQRLQSIRDAWAAGKKLPPIRLVMTEDGRLGVVDGRHRLIVAKEQRRRVLVRLSQALDGADEGTAPLFPDA